MSGDVHIFGVRHHGPGSARAVRSALESLRPDCVLVEGPPDADEVIPLITHAGMVPPVALLVYPTDEPAEAAFYPMAEFSPEYQALQWATEQGVAVRFMDLPVAQRVTLDQPETPADVLRVDPLGELAKAAGYEDGERWWEAVVEHRTEEDPDLFAAISDAMTALREAHPGGGLRDDPHREAWMRRTIRAAAKQHERIAVICGAWHAPALTAEQVKAQRKADEALLKPLKKVKTTATWVPWTYDRLAFASGYGAGVGSPGWYEHLWQNRTQIIERWLTRAARLFRDEGIDCSSAHVIEATRLAHTLGGLRGRALPDLADIADATRAVFCFDSDLGMQLIARELLVGNRLGAVPDETPMVPLQQDLLATQKRLRLKPQAMEKTIELDLRNDTDLARSHLLHRLTILGVGWGMPHYASGKGTFKEAWQLRWDPGMLVRLIELSRYGTTIAAAATGYLLEKAREEKELSALAGVVGDTMLADLPDAIAPLIERLLAVAAVGSDVAALMDAVPPLAEVLRYGSVRKTDVAMVREALDGMLPRIFVGFGGAIASLNEDAAGELEPKIIALDRAVRLIESEAHLAGWTACLRKAIEADAPPGLIRGRCCRLLFDANEIDRDDVERLLSRALSRGNEPADAAGWVEGFLRGSGLLLLHDARLLSLLDQWVCEIPAELFNEMLPLVRRTFGTFERAERRQIGEKLNRGGAMEATAAAPEAGIDFERAAKILPTLAAIFGTTAKRGTR